MSIFKTAIKDYKKGILLNKIFHKLKETNVFLFYLVEEGLFDETMPAIEPKLRPIEVVELGLSDISGLAARKERDFSEEEMSDMLSSGCVCVGMKHHNEIVSYMWYNLHQCPEPALTFKLNKNEAYLYGARVFRKYKGKALAPYLRYKVYEHLASLGRTRLYSISDFENIPSIMFKRKLNAKNLKLYLTLRISGKLKRSILLKTFK